MVLSTDSPVNVRRNSTSSLNRSANSAKSGYMLPQGQSPEDTWFNRILTEYILCGCLCIPKGARGNTLTDDELEFLEGLRTYMDRPFDSANPDHMRIFKSIWQNVFPDAEIPPPVDQRWQLLGFQSPNPATDIRTGLHSLESLEYFSRRYKDEFQRMATEAIDPRREYPFAASGVSISFSLIIFFKLNKRTAVNPVGAPSGNRAAIKQFVRLSITYRDFFDEVFCALFRRVHKEWMKQAPNTFDIHYFATALSMGMKAVAVLFNEKRIRDLTDLEQIMII